MKYNQPFDQPYSPNAGFVDGNPSTGVAGSIPPAAQMEYPQREIVNLIAAGGLTPDNGDLYQVTRATRSGLLDYFIDTGPANAVTITPSLAYGGLTAGNRFRVKTLNAPTGPTTFQVNGTVVSMRRSGATALTGGEWIAGDIITLDYDGTYAYLTSVGGSASSSNKFITSDLTMAVPSQFPTIRAALIAASLLIVASNAHIIISVAAGYIENLTSVTGPLYVSHSRGQRMSIVAPAVTGGFPTASNISGKTPAQILSYLQGKYQVTVNAVGTDALQVRSMFGSIQNVLFVGDGTTSGGHYGGKIGDWSTEVAAGWTALQNCWFHGFGTANLRLEQSAFVQGNNLGLTCSSANGAYVVHQSTLEVNFGNFLSMYNTQHGIQLTNYGIMAIPTVSGTMDISNNTVHGVALTQYGSFSAIANTGLNIKSNGGWGMYASVLSYAALAPSGGTTFSGNSSGDCYADKGSIIVTNGCSIPAGSSPTRGTTAGNFAAYVL